MVTLADKKTASVQVCWRHSRQSICSPMAFRPRSWRPRLLSSSSRCSSRRRCRPRPLMAPRPCRPQVQRLRQHSHLPQLPLGQKSLECAHPAPQLASDEFPGAQNSTVCSRFMSRAPGPLWAAAHLAPHSPCLVKSARSQSWCNKGLVFTAQGPRWTTHRCCRLPLTTCTGAPVRSPIFPAPCSRAVLTATKQQVLQPP
jgi:hypothetical protein